MAVTERTQPDQDDGLLATALGPVTLDGKTPTPRQRSIVAALVLHRDRELDTDTLIDTVWGERVPRAARPSLQNQIGRLRAEHGPDVIATGARGYRLGRVADVTRFVELVEPHVTAPADRSQLAPLEMGLALWRGIPFVDLPEAPAVEAERARLTELHALASEKLAECHLATGDPAAALHILPGLTHEDPYRERRWLLLMTALHRSGRSIEALDAYQRLEGLLAEELGTLPSSGLQDLRRRIAEGHGLRSADRPAPGGAAGHNPCSARRAQRRQRTCSSAS